MVADKGLHDELVRMFEDDQRTWGVVLNLAGRDARAGARPPG